MARGDALLWGDTTMPRFAKAKKQPWVVFYCGGVKKMPSMLNSYGLIDRGLLTIIDEMLALRFPSVRV